jgi:Chromo (CHRromatin Organisation MOdifier) domain
VPSLSVLGPKKGLRLVPLAIIDRKIVKKGNAPTVQVLIRWSNMAEEESTWEDYEEMKRDILHSFLRIKN